MSENKSNITDREIRDLIKQGILAGENNALTQTLIDMESKMVFATETIVVPSLNKEKELLGKLTAASITKSSSALLFKIAGVVLLMSVTFVTIKQLNKRNVTVPIENNKVPAPTEKQSVPTDTTGDTRNENDTAIGFQSTPPLKQKETESSREIGKHITIPVDTPKTDVDGKRADRITVKKETDTILHYTITPQISPSVSKSSTAKFVTRNKNVEITKCEIWKTEEFCTVPEHITPCEGYDCNACEFSNIRCNDPSLKGKTAVWITLSAKKKTSYQIKSDLENISLIKPNGKTIHPVAIYGFGNSYNSNYLSSGFKTKKLTAFFSKTADLIILFKDGAPGDKVIIDDFIEAEILK